MTLFIVNSDYSKFIAVASSFYDMFQPNSYVRKYLNGYTLCRITSYFGDYTMLKQVRRSVGA